MQKLSWPLTLRTIVISLVLGAASGVLATALTSSYLSDYAIQLGQLTEPLRLSDERPRVFPQSYGEALEKVIEKVIPGVAQFYQPSEKSSFEKYNPTEALMQGAVLTTDGWIITVASKQTDINILEVVVGQDVYSIEEVVFDDLTGAVFVKINANNLPVMAFGDGLSLGLGEQVFALPARQTLLVTSIYAYDFELPYRQIVLQNSVGEQAQGTSVANLAGELIGLVKSSGDLTSKVIPIEFILPAFNSLLKEGEVMRASLGAKTIHLSQAIGLSSELSREYEQGALILSSDDIEADSPAAEAGLIENDIIISVDGQIINGRSSLDEYIMQHMPGDSITLLVDREEEQIEIEVTLASSD